MFFNYIKATLRGLLRHKSTSTINILGLAVGIAVSLMITLWVQYELRYDDFQEKGDRICRVITNYSDIGKRACSPGLLGPAARTDLPEIVEFARFKRLRTAVIANQETSFFEDDIILADAQLFTMFSLPFARSSAESALSSPYSIAISESMAEKYFGDQDPLGKVLTMDSTIELTVTGVFRDVPGNSHLKFDFVSPVELAEKENFCGIDWGSSNFNTYFEVTEAARLTELDSAIMAVSRAHDGGNGQLEGETTWYLQRLSDIHLDGSIGHSWSKRSDIEDVRHIYLFSIIAFAVLIVACINFMNISTAQSIRRAREIGMRKTLGASRVQLMTQFFGESLVLACIAGGLAVGLVELLLPVFNGITNEHVCLDMSNLTTLLSIGGIVIIAGLLAGSYPAVYLSSFKASKVLKSNSRVATGGNLFRRILVAVQFTVSIVLIIGTAIMYQQLSYTIDYTPGYDNSDLIHISIRDNIASQYDYVRESLLQNPDIIAVTAKDCLPNTHRNRTNWISWEGLENSNRHAFETTRIDLEYFATMGMEIVEGRDFSKEHPGDATRAYILNETAVMQTGMESPVGKWFAHGENVGPIVGIVRDAHLKTFKREAVAQVFSVLNDLPEQTTSSAVILIKTTGQNTRETISAIEGLWEKVNPGTPFEYGFLDETMGAMYIEDRNQQTLLSWFAGMTIFVSCLGLLGLVMSSSERRIREIAIRKALGSSVTGIVRLLSNEFLGLVALANVFAIPIAWYWMTRWLENFAYHIDPDWTTFALAGVGAIILALLTTSLQSLRAAMMNPADILRHE
ncbi:MAG: ABC transporter permease [Bacteroidales bacterium]|nr:ABC transporter permease [Candidatus Latescibacterota bacterium]